MCVCVCVCVQCARLREKLSSLLPKHTAQYGEPLWVMSPLTRALQTFLLSCPYPERVHAAQPSLTNITNMTQQPFGAAGGSTGAASSGTQGGVAPLHVSWYTHTHTHTRCPAAHARARRAALRRGLCVCVCV